MRSPLRRLARLAQRVLLSAAKLRLDRVQHVGLEVADHEPVALGVLPPVLCSDGHVAAEPVPGLGRRSRRFLSFPLNSTVSNDVCTSFSYYHFFRKI